MNWKWHNPTQWLDGWAGLCVCMRALARCVWLRAGLSLTPICQAASQPACTIIPISGCGWQRPGQVECCSTSSTAADYACRHPLRPAWGRQQPMVGCPHSCKPSLSLVIRHCLPALARTAINARDNRGLRAKYRSQMSNLRPFISVLEFSVIHVSSVDTSAAPPSLSVPVCHNSCVCGWCFVYTRALLAPGYNQLGCCYLRLYTKSQWPKAKMFGSMELSTPYRTTYILIGLPHAEKKPPPLQ